MEKEKNLQQEEAALSILMDLHGQQEGQRLWEAFEASGEKLPRKTDQKLRKILAPRKYPPFYRAALILLSFLLFGALSICAAEAGGLLEIRVPIWKGYFVTQLTDSVLVHFPVGTPSRPQDPARVQQTLEKWMPQGFGCDVSYIRSYPSDNPGFYALYTDGGEREIYLRSEDPTIGLVEVNARDAQVDEIRYLDRDMALVTTDGGWTVVWLNKEENLCYTLCGKGIRESEFWAMVSALLTSEEGVG